VAENVADQGQLHPGFARQAVPEERTSRRENRTLRRCTASIALLANPGLGPRRLGNGRASRVQFFLTDHAVGKALRCFRCPATALGEFRPQPAAPGTTEEPEFSLAWRNRKQNPVAPPRS